MMTRSLTKRGLDVTKGYNYHYDDKLDCWVVSGDALHE
jgi:hypothetical protein